MKHLIASITLILLFSVVPFVHAEEFAIKKIGALDVTGTKLYNHYWYEPTRLTLEGTGSRGANIDIFVDDSVTTIKANTADGTWKYTNPTELEKKDHTIKVGSGDQMFSFILTIGAATVPADQAPKGGLLQAGNMWSLIGLCLLGAGLVYIGFRKNEA